MLDGIRQIRRYRTRKNGQVCTCIKRILPDTWKSKLSISLQLALKSRSRFANVIQNFKCLSGSRASPIFRIRHISF